MTKSIITVRDVTDIKEKIRFLISLEHPDNRYNGLSESKVAKLFLNQSNSVDEEYIRILALTEK